MEEGADAGRAGVSPADASADGVSVAAAVGVLSVAVRMGRRSEA